MINNYYCWFFLSEKNNQSSCDEISDVKLPSGLEANPNPNPNPNHTPTLNPPGASPGEKSVTACSSTQEDGEKVEQPPGLNAAWIGGQI